VSQALLDPGFAVTRHGVHDRNRAFHQMVVAERVKSVQQLVERLSRVDGWTGDHEHLVGIP
jgi:hypothetical protein